MKKTKYKLRLDDEETTLCVDHYSYGGGLALFFICESGEPFLTLTTNLPGVPLAAGTFAIKNWSENEPYIKDIFGMGIFEECGFGIRTGFVHAPVWKLKPGVVL